jgi:hypothetical protein
MKLFRKSAIDLTGRIVGRLTVLSFWGRKGSANKLHWLCRCECGNKVIVCSQSLLSGRIHSCGCYQREVTKITHTTHGKSQGDPLYAAWERMRSRCSPKSDMSKHYFERGIRIDPEWDSFINFDRDMRPTWIDGLELDRKNNNGNYSKENCRWTDRTGQMNNTRNNKKYLCNGELLTGHQIARIFDANPGLVDTRLRRGWSVEKAVNQPVRRRVI